MNELTGEWVEKAENDFHSADLLLTAGEFPIPDAACFHCQQCAEKYLKAFLQEHMVRFERTHSLTLLLDLCKTQDQDFEKLRSELEQLENYSVAVRYPGVKISVELAEEAFELATKVRQFVRSKLGLK
jgi:HEPN domain-containing protein